MTKENMFVMRRKGQRHMYPSRRVATNMGQLNEGAVGASSDSQTVPLSSIWRSPRQLRISMPLLKQTDQVRQLFPLITAGATGIQDVDTSFWFHTSGRYTSNGRARINAKSASFLQRRTGSFGQNEPLR
jgi:hypothetical protein